MANRTINFTAFSMNLQYQFAMFFVILAIVCFCSNRVGNWPLLYCAGTERDRERGQERKLNNYSTKIYEGVPIIVKGQCRNVSR